MTVARKRAKSAFIDGKIFVIGGTEESFSMNWAEVFDLKTQTWKPFPSPCDDAKVQLCRGEECYTLIVSLKGMNMMQKKEFPGSWCFIVNVKFSVFETKLMWYDSERRNWFMVEGLEDLYMKRVIYYSKIRLAKYNGKLVILSDFIVPVAGKRQIHYCEKNKRKWCAVVISLEKRVSFSGLD